MTCYHPMRVFKVDVHPSGKPKYMRYSYDTQIVKDVNGNEVVNSTVVPCGRCIGCRLEYARNWANRCMLELPYHENAFFITLTYNDDCVPQSGFANPETGELLYTLKKEDWQKFMKRLRYFTNDKLMYMACGEYGSRTYRPHYHAIIFGLNLDDLEIYKKNFEGDFLYTSKTLQKAWPFGFSTVGSVNFQTCSYVARYVVKKLTGKASEVYDNFGLEKPFIVRSNKPSIGKRYFEEHYPDIYRYDRIVLPDKSGGKSFQPPKYFDKLYEELHPEHLLDIQVHREQIAIQHHEKKLKDLKKMGLEYEDYLYIEEDNLLAKLGYVKERSAI